MRRQLREGRLRAAKKGRVWRIFESELEADTPGKVLTRPSCDWERAAQEMAPVYRESLENNGEARANLARAVQPTNRQGTGEPTPGARNFARRHGRLAVADCSADHFVATAIRQRALDGRTQSQCHQRIEQEEINRRADEMLARRQQERQRERQAQREALRAKTKRLTLDELDAK